MSRSDLILPPQALPPDLAAALSRAAGRIGPFGHYVHWYAELRSTNDLAATLAEQGADEGAVVIADAQTAGRGRHGRVWCSPPGAGLYVSVVLRPDARVLALVTIAAGVALVEGIRAATGLAANLKWPNDVYVNGRKLAGILAETRSPSGAGLQVCVLGLGINIRAAAYPPDVARRATALDTELGRDIDRALLLVECLAAMAARYDDLRRERAAAVLDAWRTYARPLLGRTIEWDSPQGVRRGTAVDVDATGALLVRTAEGTAQVIAGEVRWI